MPERETTLSAVTDTASPAAGFPLDSRRNNFNFMRVIFAVWALYSHCFALVANGYQYFDVTNFTRGQTFLGHIAVEGFFIISGFLITMSWFRCRGPGDFLRRRALRIYPGYIAACLFCILLIAPLGSASARGYFAALSVPSLIRQLATLDKLTLPPHFMDSPFPGQINGSLWTIRIEFECYLLLPLLMWLGVLRRRGAALALTVCVVVLNALIESPLRNHLGRLASESVVSHVELMVFFLTGMTAYLYRDRFLTGRAPVFVSLAILTATALGGGFNIVMPVFGTYLLLAAAFSPRIPLHRFGERVDLSYGIYLYGWPVKRIFTHFLGTGINPYTLFALALPTSCLLAAGSWFLIEKPFLNLKKSGAGRALPKASA